MPRTVWFLLALFGVACATPDELRRAAGEARLAGDTALAASLLRSAADRQASDTPERRAVAADLRRELAGLLLASDKPQEAERLYLEALALLAAAPRGNEAAIINLRTQLAGLCYRQNRLDEAAVGYQAVLDLETRELGETHPDVLGTMGILGGLEFKRGRLAQAEVLFHRQLAGVRQAYGPEKREVTPVLEDLAAVLARSGRPEAAESLRIEAARIRRKLCDEC
jgi:hypothetical protein